jgi:hypothetical protein
MSIQFVHPSTGRVGTGEGYVLGSSLGFLLDSFEHIYLQSVLCKVLAVRGGGHIVDDPVLLCENSAMGLL